jgi:hypothetical protein
MKTFSGKLLLGWMSKEEALAFLMGQAVPPLSEAAAIELWESYRQKVAQLGNRGCQKPATGKHSLKEKLAADRIIKASRKNGQRNVKALIKVDPLDLVVHQLRIFEERAEPYVALVCDPVMRVKTCLPSLPGSIQLQFKRVAGKTIIELPHGEFRIALGPNNKPAIQEMAHHIAITPFDDRFLLWAGYHRTYAVTLASQANPEEIERLVPAVLTTDAEDDFLAETARFSEKRAMVFGACPALFRDFFDPDLCLSINLRKQRPQFEIDLTGTRMVWVDDDS